MGATAAAVAAAALLLAGFGVAAVSEPAEAGARDACGVAEAEAQDATVKALRRAVVCLANTARAERGAERVGRDAQLTRAAQRHAKAMSETDCLSSRCPGEPDLEARIEKAGYFEGARRWGYAENTGCAVSPAAMVKSWLASPVHRANLLEAKFRDVGVGVLANGPASRCEEGLAVFSAVFAWRKA